MQCGHLWSLGKKMVTNGRFPHLLSPPMTYWHHRVPEWVGNDRLTHSMTPDTLHLQQRQLRSMVLASTPSFIWPAVVTSMAENRAWVQQLVLIKWLTFLSVIGEGWARREVVLRAGVIYNYLCKAKLLSWTWHLFCFGLFLYHRVFNCFEPQPHPTALLCLSAELPAVCEYCACVGHQDQGDQCGKIWHQEAIQVSRTHSTSSLTNLGGSSVTFT